ncbi:MAG: AsmA-like C-terminal region-containing protein, partial [Terriglobales bacterium]
RADGEVRRRGDEWRLQLNFQEEAGRAEQLLAGLYRGEGEVTGALSLRGVLTSEGEDGSDFWRNLGGNIRLEMRDGRIGRYTSTAKLLALLNVGQLLELKGPELAAAGMPYQRLTADFKIQRGMARTENLVLDSPAMMVNAVGSVNLVDDTVRAPAKSSHNQ